jgi:hypothetical protein
MPLNRDALLAVVLLVICGIFWQQSFEIREPDYAQMSPAVWPRAVLAILSLLCLIYLVRSLRPGPREPMHGLFEEPAEEPDAGPNGGPGGVKGFLAHWRNVIWCFALFLAYLWTMPFLGMLVGGMLFVFLLLNALGGWSPRLMALHAVIAVVTIGGMWSLFTFGLRVFLPTGSLFGRF